MDAEEKRREREQLEALIATSAWGRNLSADQLGQVCGDAKHLHVAAGQTVCHRGAQADYWYGVIDGLVKAACVSCAGRPTTLIGIPTGSWFGEGAVLKKELRPYDVIALHESRLVLIPTATFHWLLATSLPFNAFMIAHLNARLAQFVRRLEHARSHDPEQHVTHCLIELFNAELYPGTSNTLQISQEEIAYLAGVSRQLANRALRRLESAKLLELRYGTISVRNVEALRSLAVDVPGGPA